MFSGTREVAKEVFSQKSYPGSFTTILLTCSGSVCFGFFFFFLFPESTLKGRCFQTINDINQTTKNHLKCLLLGVFYKEENKMAAAYYSSVRGHYVYGKILYR